MRTRSADPYKPSALRAYEQALRHKLLPALGHLKLAALTRHPVQDLVDRLVAEGLSASTTRNAVLPLRAIYRRPSRALRSPKSDRGALAPGGAGTARPGRPTGGCPALLAALPLEDRAVWATALYAGLRRGELAALRWQDVDLERGVICVKLLGPKGGAGRA